MAINPTDELKIVLDDLRNELKLYEWYIVTKSYSKKVEELINERINFLKLQISIIETELNADRLS